MKILLKGTAFVFALLFLGLSASAKDTASVYSYFKVGGSVWSHFSINQKLENSQGDGMKAFAPEIGYGVLVNYKQFQYYLELDGTFDKNKNGNIPYQFGYAAISLGAKYAVFHISQQPIYVGLELSIVPMYLDLLPKNSTVDLNHITPTTQTGEVNMHSTPVLLGPTLASGDLFPKSKFNMNVAVTYQFNVIRSKWKSKYSEVINSPLEDGNRLQISLLFPINN